MPSAYHLSCYTLAGLFLWSGWLLLFGPSFIAEEFRKWKYPDWLRVAVGVAEWSIAGMLILQFAPRLAILVAAAIMVAVVVTFVRDRQFKRLDNPLLVLALLGIAYPLSPPLGVVGI
jgi:uncharacterized membrane protein YphA (DoxX/SURF4 family)